jgi:glycolate oxidase FAD binding subunit
VDLDLLAAEREVADAVAAAAVVDPVGSRTHREVGGPVPNGIEVASPAGIVAYDPAELTVTVGAGTTVADLSAVLGAAGQECPLDPRDAVATVGGTLACGLSGYRRLRYGPLRDRVLEVRFANAEGQLVRGGGPTVKNVTGYDMPRLLVGSFGTLGVLTRVILRCQPQPVAARWGTSDEAPDAVRRRCFRPSAVLWDGTTTSVLLEGHPEDVARQSERARIERLDVPPELPDGPHRGRVSVAPARLADVGRALAGLDGVRWMAESGVGTVHVACDDERGLAGARVVATEAGGWLLREAGGPSLDGFGVDLPNAALMARIKAAFDPQSKLAPGRLRFGLEARDAAPS